MARARYRSPAGIASQMRASVLCACGVVGLCSSARTGPGEGRIMKAFTYIDGTWHEGNPPLLGPMSHATWLSSIIFDGARAFEGVSPDLDRHCERAINSARTMGLRPMLSAGEVEELAREGIRKH